MLGRAHGGLVLACLLSLACAMAAGCAEGRPAILMQEGSVSVENQTGERWTNVEIWMNDHYRVTARALEPGGRLIVPLDAFVAGFGQRFDRRRQSVFGIEVTARDASGRDVRLVWGKGRRRV
jgi:hypothetical protein